MVHAAVWAQDSTYQVHYIVVDSASQSNQPVFTTAFSSKEGATAYLTGLPTLLQAKGYISASVDTISYDSTHAQVQLFLGQLYKWARLRTLPEDEVLLQGIRWNNTAFIKKPLLFSEWQNRQQQLLNYMEESGYPFARIYLDSILLNNQEIAALVRIDRGPLYKIDSIRVYGEVNVSNEFLQHHLNIENGSIYSKLKLAGISKRLAELPYLTEEQPSTVSYLSTGSVLNLYLKPKKSSQINLLAGLLPSTDQASGKNFQLTMDANLMLRNALGIGETIGLVWQKLQPQSQRLNLLYEHPYIFRSPLGLGFSFDMFRKDSSFLNINMKLDTRYGVNEYQWASFFFLRQQSIANGINLQQVQFSRQLPPEVDVSSNNLGSSFSYNNTNYRFNPQRGNELLITASAGIKRIKKNNQILEIKDPNEPSFDFARLYDTVKLKTYQFRVTASAAHFFPLGKQSTVKTAINGGVFNSGNIFRNELFQIGGYRLLRGFDEESQYVSQYAVGTVEYRYLIGQNSNFFAFVDGGWGQPGLGKGAAHTYIGTGLGLSFETKAGLFNLAWALGKRDDTELNLRQSKIHFGFVNYF
jgi:outer membrane protein assembly factor BamA